MFNAAACKKREGLVEGAPETWVSLGFGLAQFPPRARTVPTSPRDEKAPFLPARAEKKGNSILDLCADLCEKWPRRGRGSEREGESRNKRDISRDNADECRRQESGMRRLARRRRSVAAIMGRLGKASGNGSGTRPIFRLHYRKLLDDYAQQREQRKFMPPLPDYVSYCCCRCGHTQKLQVSSWVVSDGGSLVFVSLGVSFLLVFLEALRDQFTALVGPSKN